MAVPISEARFSDSKILGRRARPPSHAKCRRRPTAAFHMTRNEIDRHDVRTGAFVWRASSHPWEPVTPDRPGPSSHLKAWQPHSGKGCAASCHADGARPRRAPASRGGRDVTRLRIHEHVWTPCDQRRLAERAARQQSSSLGEVSTGIAVALASGSGLPPQERRKRKPRAQWRQRSIRRDTWTARYRCTAPAGAG